ncbi:hypothetical protein [Myceligenerans crystallogenes]|uniref:Uncharacterized protein n=1 Tax=Myceligenerans crystallogenes TaxID=316335 RepID=A0ABP4ZKE0_9MICO
MPREITILSPRPLSDVEVLQAATDAIPEVGVRRIQPGALLQFAASSGDEAEIVLTMEQPSYLRAPEEIERLHPGTVLPAAMLEAMVQAAIDPATSQAVWIDATAPATPLGLVGAGICERLAAAAGGVCIVQDGR